jgi:hypothetical protein
MTQHNHESRAELRCRKFDTVNLGRRHHVTRHPDHEKIPQPLVKDHFGGNPRVGTPQDNGNGFLL